MADRNQIAVLKVELMKQEQMRVAALSQLLAVISEHHGGRVRIAKETLITIGRGVFQCAMEDRQGILTLTMCDSKGTPLVTPLPSGVTAHAMAREICDSSPEGLVQLDSETLAELFEAYYQNCKRAEIEAKQPKLATAPVPEEAPVERCPECWLAFGEHRESCSKKAAVAGKMEAMVGVPANR